MESNDSKTAERADSFIRAILLLGALGAVWLVVMIAYALWIGLVG